MKPTIDINEFENDLDFNNEEDKEKYYESKIIAKITNSIYIVRKRKNLTQEGLAKLCGYKQETIARIENGGTVPTLKTIINISYYLHDESALSIIFDEIIKEDASTPIKQYKIESNITKTNKVKKIL